MKNVLACEQNYLQRYPESFVHLHLHTQYSLLDGAIRLPELFKRAKEYSMPAVAMTDHGNMFGAIDFYTQAIKAGVKPILGSEVYITAGSRFERISVRQLHSKGLDDEGKHHIHHLVLLCKNNKGYQNLCKLLSKAYLEGFYYKPRIDYEILEEYSEGIIATSACSRGEVGFYFASGEDNKAYQAIDKLQAIFGDDFYLELQDNGTDTQRQINNKIIDYARLKNIGLVATNDCHYMDREMAVAQDVLLCIQMARTFNDEGRPKRASSEYYFKTPEQMRSLFAHVPDACDNTLKIAEQCNVELRWSDESGKQIYHLPDFDIATGETTEEFFRRMCREGLEERFRGPHFRKLIRQENWQEELKPLYLRRLQSEVDMIVQTGFPGYFLIVSDFIKWAKQREIPVGPGRGSGAGSLVAYAMKITNINPLPFNLLFERFINPERISMPDFDVDFCQDRRQEVIDYVMEKYGEDKVGQIITFGKLQAKAVIRDVSRVYDLPYAEADALAKLVPDELGITLNQALEKEPKFKELEERDPKIRQIIKISKQLEGLLRHASIHAAGVIITNEPLDHYCPLFRGREGERVVQFDKDFSELIGLVKFDFLGLKTLTVIQNAVNFIRRDVDETFDIESIDLEDRKVYEFISSGNTTGVFQLESSGMKDLCKRIAPDNLDDITAINALYRPGPLGSGMVDDFIEIKHGRKKTVYPFPELEPVLNDTYGIIVYQEQVMNISRIIAGYSLGQADMLRRAMGKKKIKEMEHHKEIFRQGAQDKGYDEKKALELFDLMAKFAEYGFNKSHAVAYALIAYQTAYLKRYHPAAFFAALLGTEMQNTDKLTNYINDAKECGIEILPPDVNESLWLFNVLGKSIRFGMGAVKNVGKGAVEEIIRERSENGPFKGLVDFCQRVSLKLINKRVIESLIKVGAFDSCEQMNRHSQIKNLEFIINYSLKVHQERSVGQANLFSPSQDGQREDQLVSKLELELFDDFEEKQKLQYEAELIGIYVSGHPLQSYERLMAKISSMSIYDAHHIKGTDAREMTLCGMLSGLKKIITKKGDRMAFANLEDLSGKIECVIFPKTYAEFSEFLEVDQPLVIKGSVKLQEEPRKLFPNKIHFLKDETEDRVRAVRLNCPIELCHEYTLENIKKVLQSYRGTVPVELVFNDNSDLVFLPLGEEFLVNPTPQMAAKINSILNTSAVDYIMQEDIQSNQGGC